MPGTPIQQPPLRFEPGASAPRPGQLQTNPTRILELPRACDDSKIRPCAAAALQAVALAELRMPVPAPKTVCRGTYPPLAKYGVMEFLLD